MSMVKTTVNSWWKGTEVKIQGKRVTGKTSFELGLIIEGQAKLLCPVDLGYLAASITVASTTQKTQTSSVKANPSKATTRKSFNDQRAHYSFWNEMPDNFQPIDPPTDENEVFVGTVVEYGPYIEFGTVRSDAQPFLRPALDLAKGRMLTILEKNGRFYFKDYLQ